MKKLLTITVAIIALTLVSCSQEEEMVVKEGQLEGILLEELSGQNQRTMTERRRVSGVGVSVRTLVGSSRTTNSLNSYKSEEESYTITDENGEFSLDGIPEGNYVVVFEYEDLPTNPNSNNQINITGTSDQKISIEGLIKNNSIYIETNVE